MAEGSAPIRLGVDSEVRRRTGSWFKGHAEILHDITSVDRETQVNPSKLAPPTSPVRN